MTDHEENMAGNDSSLAETTQLKAELEAAKRRIAALQKENDALHWLISAPHYEFGTRLNIIRGYTELLLEQTDTGESLAELQVKANAAIGKAADRMLEMLDDVISAGKAVRLLNSPHDPQKVVFGQLIQDMKFKLEASLTELPPLWIEEHSIQYAIWLFEREMSAGSPESILLSAIQNKNSLIVTLRNPQFLLPEEGYGYLVEPSTKLLTCNEERIGISPLCLGSVLIRKQGGEVYLESQEETGTVITFTLPIYGEETVQNDPDHC